MYGYHDPPYFLLENTNKSTTLAASTSVYSSSYELVRPYVLVSVYIFTVLIISPFLNFKYPFSITLSHLCIYPLTTTSSSSPPPLSSFNSKIRRKNLLRYSVRQQSIHNIRAILLPESNSAIHSVQLRENQAQVSLVTTRVSESPTCPYNITDKGGNQTNLAITHSQSQDDEKFSFGSSGISNDFTSSF